MPALKLPFKIDTTNRLKLPSKGKKKLNRKFRGIKNGDKNEYIFLLVV
jgi:hypothetical protein